MEPAELTQLEYLLSSNLNQYPSHFGLFHNTTPAYQFNRVSNNLYELPQVQEFNLQTTGNSTSDEADEQQVRIINERKQRRMISNRESARRSRMRKQRHLDELWSLVGRLRAENHQLIDKLNQVSESHDQAIQENAQLKEETSELRQIITDMQLHSPYRSIIRDFDDHNE
ncbi:basic leucine zipper 43-like [Olea europaea subsp. europaea]|uniref:Basic leucine zipper 43-like n=1 Tax=Olea europaea subsp. europaea TaxID=158383 RepID=A0A8S0T391_OLEEU|nr:basic leucine zipper 43-like [Olea europaea subsp. europaea]